MAGTDIGNVPPRSGLRMLQRQVVAVDTDTVTFSNLHAVDGDEYVIIGQCIGGVGAVASQDCTLQPNALTTNQNSQVIQGVSLANVATLYLTSTSAATVGWGFEGRMRLKVGLGGRGYNSAGNFLTGGGTYTMAYCGGEWHEAVTEITSLVVKTSAATCIGVGSILSLWVITPA